MFPFWLEINFNVRVSDLCSINFGTNASILSCLPAKIYFSNYFGSLPGRVSGVLGMAQLQVIHFGRY